MSQLQVELVAPTSTMGLTTPVPVAADGSYKIPSGWVQYATLRVTTGETGLADTWYGNVSRQEDAVVLNLEGRSFRSLDVTVAQGGTISGTVHVPAGVDPGTLTVMAESNYSSPSYQQFPALKKSAVPAADGTYRITGLPANGYTIRVQPGQSGLLETWYGSGADKAAAVKVEVAKGEIKGGLDIALRAPAAISGTVAYPAGVEPVAGSIGIFSVSGTRIGGGTFSADGVFSLPAVPAETIKLAFVVSANVPNLAWISWYPNANELGTAEALVLAEGEQRTGLVAQLQAAGSITGTVNPTTKTGGVQLLGSLGQVINSTQPDATTGKYTISRVTPGSYKVLFGGQPAMVSLPTAPQYFPGVPENLGRGAAGEVLVTAGTVTQNINATMAPGASISGTVLGPTGEPVSGGNPVRSISKDGSVQERRALITSGGRFIIQGLPDGDFVIEVQSDPDSDRNVRWRHLYSGNATELNKAQPIVIRNGVSASAGVLSYQTAGAEPSDAAGKFIPLKPTRILDTRHSYGRLFTIGTHILEVGGRNGVPPDATAVAVNVTVTEPDWEGVASATAFGSRIWDTSTVNYGRGETVPNYSVVPVINGKIVIGIDSSVSTGSAHVIADIAGYFTGGGSAALPGTYSPITPFRAVDSRSTGGVAGGQTLNVQVAGAGGVPAGAAAVVVNITAARFGFDSLNYGHLTAFASGASRPGTSNVNYEPFKDVPNMAVVPVGADGKISIANTSPGKTGVVVDVMGYFLPGAGTVEGSYQAMVPTRLKDTRLEAGPVYAWTDVSIPIGGANGIPAGAKAAMVNLTVTQPSAPGHLTAYPSGTALPGVSNVNFTKGQTVANFAIVPIGADGRIRVRNSSTGPIHLVVDVFGYVR